MVSDRAKDGNRKFGPRAGGTREISRWCNHRTTPTKHEPRPERAREGQARCGGQHRRGTFERFSRPCRGASRIGGGGRFVSGGSRSLRDLHHRLISFEPPARESVSSYHFDGRFGAGKHMVAAMFRENSYFTPFISSNGKGVAKPSFRVIWEANPESVARKVASSESCPTFGRQVVGQFVPPAFGQFLHRITWS